MKIIFDIFPSHGHQHASHKLAQLLKDRGHEIYYIGYHNYFKNLPSEFNRKYITPHIFNFIENTYGKLGKDFKLAIKEKKIHEYYKNNQLIIQQYDRLIEELQPDVILVDHHYIQKAILYHKYNILTISIQTAPASEMDPTIPPFFSSHIPTGTPCSQIYTKYIWWKYLAWKKCRLFFKAIFFLGEDHLSEVKRLAKETGFPLKDNIDFKHYKGYGEFGLKNIPQLLLSPRDFDFPHPLRKEQYAIGPLIYPEHSQPIRDKRYLKLVEYLTNEKKKQNISIIYCSLGTLNDFHLKNSIKIFRQVIEVARRHPEYHVILSTGEILNPGELLPTPDNVYMFKLLPQKHLLPHCDMMIAHGGQNSITECIINEIPLLIYPFFNESDLGGNSARVIYHGIGNRGFIKKDNVDSMEKKITDVLFNPVYRKNIHLLKQKLEKKNNSIEAVEIIEKLTYKYYNHEHETHL